MSPSITRRHHISDVGHDLAKVQVDGDNYVVDVIFEPGALYEEGSGAPPFGGAPRGAQHSVFH